MKKNLINKVNILENQLPRMARKNDENTLLDMICK